MMFAHIHSTKEKLYGLFNLHVQLDFTIGDIQNQQNKIVIDKKITYSARGFGVLTADFVNDNIGKEFNVRMEVQKWKEKKHPFMTPM